MSIIFYGLVRLLVAALQALPLRLAAFIGRCGGAIAWLADRRHRAVVLQNLTAACPEKTAGEVVAIGRETLKRIGENYAAAIKTASFDLSAVRQICDVSGLEKFPRFGGSDGPKNCVVAIGHFGNFELYAILGKLVPGLSPAATYRGLRQPLLNNILRSLRDLSGCRFYERRTEAAELKEALNQGGLLLGLLADQHLNRGGVWVPFMGRNCATTPAPALLALRYGAPLFTAICFRTALGRWRVEVGDEIPTRQNGAARDPAAIMTDVNQAFETAVRRDPANWFWVHKRWKPPAKPPAPSAPISP